MNKYSENSLNYNRIREMFFLEFAPIESFTSTEAAETRKKEADEWWQKNHLETPEEHR